MVGTVERERAGAGGAEPCGRLICTNLKMPHSSYLCLVGFFPAVNFLIDRFLLHNAQTMSVCQYKMCTTFSNDNFMVDM